MILYHFTSVGHLPRILRLGMLTTTESNVSMIREHAGPDVVWLTSTADPPHDQFAWAENSVFNKTRVRFTVDVNRRAAKPWLSWSIQQGMDRRWREAMITTGGGMSTARSWYVVTRPILHSEWVRTHIRRGVGFPWIDGPMHTEEMTSSVLDAATGTERNQE